MNEPYYEMEEDPKFDGWNYSSEPGKGDCRKLCTLQQDGMMWIGIRAWYHKGSYWVNNNEPEKAHVLAWRDLPEPARGSWQRGRLYIPGLLEQPSRESGVKVNE